MLRIQKSQLSSSSILNEHNIFDYCQMNKCAFCICNESFEFLENERFCRNNNKKMRREYY